jgi:hypothetical protein
LYTHSSFGVFHNTLSILLTFSTNTGTSFCFLNSRTDLGSSCFTLVAFLVVATSHTNSESFILGVGTISEILGVAVPAFFESAKILVASCFPTKSSSFILGAVAVSGAFVSGSRTSFLARVSSIFFVSSFIFVVVSGALEAISSSFGSSTFFLIFGTSTFCVSTGHFNGFVLIFGTSTFCVSISVLVGGINFVHLSFIHFIADLKRGEVTSFHTHNVPAAIRASNCVAHIFIISSSVSLDLSSQLTSTTLFPASISAFDNFSSIQAACIAF